jgi:transcriptional antiterminator/mannitol/fructose-specific phosphotransferase system IIA component (Ntr-type)
MIVMNKRSCNILYELIGRGKTPNINEFSRLFNVTTRTIRADINEINRFLEQMGFPPVKTINDGLILMDREIDFTPVRLKLEKMGYYFYKMSPKERQSIIILLLAKEHRYLTMTELSETLYVSRQTIMSDVGEIKDFLKSHGIMINSQVHKGVAIQSDERNLRSLIDKVLSEYSPNVRERSIFGKMVFAEVANSYSLDEVSRWLNKTEEAMSLKLSDKGFHNLLLFLFIALNRISRNCVLEKIEKKNGSIDDTACQFARSLYASFDLQYSLGINEVEINALASFIQDNEVYPLSSNINNYTDVNIILANFLFSVFNNLGIRLSNTTSNELFEFLVFHIRALTERINSNIQANNPYCEQIMDEYVDVYNAVKDNIYLIEEYLGDQVAQDEIAFITMHIRAAIERAQSTKPRLSIVVACPGSMATGQLLAAQIANHFNFYIREIVAADRLVENFQLNEKDIDFVVSSVELPECDLPYLVVNPILKDKDFCRIKSLAKEISVRKKAENINAEVISSSINRDILKKSVSNNMEPALPDKGSKTKVNGKCKKSMKKAEQPFLYEIIKPSLIETGGKAKDWRDAVRQVGKILVESGYVKTDYIGSMIAKVEEFGPYCVIVKGMALAHARSNNDVFSTGLSLLVLPDGIKFGHETNDPVYLLFCFCVNDDRDYLNALTDLIALGKQKDFIPRILSADNGHEIFEVMKQWELNLEKHKAVS